MSSSSSGGGGGVGTSLSLATQRLNLTSLIHPLTINPRALGEKTDGFRDALEKRIRKAVNGGQAQNLLGRLERGEKVQQACILNKRCRDLQFASKLKGNPKTVRKTHNWVPVSPGCSWDVNSTENVAKEMECNNYTMPTTTEGGARNEQAAAAQRKSVNEGEEVSITAKMTNKSQKLEVDDCQLFNESKDVINQVTAGAGSTPSPVENHHSTIKSAIKAMQDRTGMKEFGLPVAVSPECPSKPRTNTSAAEITYQKHNQAIENVSLKSPENQYSSTATCTTQVSSRKSSPKRNNVMKLVDELERRVSNSNKQKKENERNSSVGSAVAASTTRYSGRRSETDEKQKRSSKKMDPEDRESYDMYPVHCNTPMEPTEGENYSWENGFGYPDAVGGGGGSISSVENEFNYQESDIFSDDDVTAANSQIEAQYDAAQKTEEHASSGQPQDNKQGEEENTGEKDEMFFVPDWARGIALATALNTQFGSPKPQDPDMIFHQEFSTCDLERIFERGRKCYSKRTSSGNWKHDKLTIAEKIKYKEDMGYAARGVAGTTA